MPTIDILIRNKTASAVDPPCIVCGNSDYNVKFNFNEEWQAMGITKPAASEPQIEEGDLLSVARLSYGVPLKWQTRKIDATVIADSTNLVTSGAVYAAIQEAITNLTNVGE